LESLMGCLHGFSLQAEREREREMEENSKCFLLMCLLKYALHHRLINAAVKEWITLCEYSGFTKNGRTLLHIVI
ncbi:hypothetical protein T02_14419, partial [Trichinella nativa]